MEPKYLILSHHPKEKNTSVSATIYNVFLGSKAVYQNAEYISTKLTKKEFNRELANKLNNDVVLLFNGCGSLLDKNSIYAINYAKKQKIPVVVYWHETAWMLNCFSASNPKHWAKLEQLLQESNVKHWVTFGQAKQLIMYIFNRDYEDVLIVHEAIDLDNYVPANRLNNKKDIKIVGSGVINYREIFCRKGIDYFCKICEELSKIKNANYQGYWYGGTKEDALQQNVHIPENCNFLGFVNNFYEQLRNNDIFLLTSRDDPAPIVAFEALACDLPVFCFDSVGTKEIVPSEFIASDINEMVDNIMKYWENKHKYPPNYFRSIAEDYTSDMFLERIHKKRNLIYLNYFSDQRKTLTKRIWHKLKNSRLNFFAHQSTF